MKAEQNEEVRLPYRDKRDYFFHLHLMVVDHHLHQMKWKDPRSYHLDLDVLVRSITKKDDEFYSSQNHLLHLTCEICRSSLLDVVAVNSVLVSV